MKCACHHNLSSEHSLLPRGKNDVLWVSFRWSRKRSSPGLSCYWINRISWVLKSILKSFFQTSELGGTSFFFSFVQISSIICTDVLEILLPLAIWQPHGELNNGYCLGKWGLFQKCSRVGHIERSAFFLHFFKYLFSPILFFWKGLILW